MKKNTTILIGLFLILIILIGLVIFVYHKNANKTDINKKNPLVDSALINPASLDWKEVVTEAPWPKRDSHAALVFKDKIWLMGGVDGTKRMISPGNVDYGNAQHFSDVWSSEDGVNWKLALSRAPWGNRRSTQVVDFKGKMWLIGGYGPDIGSKNDVWSSENGVNWKLETRNAGWTGREGHQVVVFKNKMYLIGGVEYTSKKVFSDVWSSENGVNWQEETKKSGWSPRWDFSATVFQNKLWVAGGMDLTQNMFNDVWSSEDGVNWKLINDNPPFSTRQGLIIEYSGNLWVIGRLNDVTNKGVNDVWYSKDGLSWTKTEKDPLWTGREDFGGIIFKDKIWILGGMDKNWRWTNDVWCSI